MREAVWFSNPSRSFHSATVEWSNACCLRNLGHSTARKLNDSSTIVDVFLFLDMAKGKKTVVRNERKLGDGVDSTVSSLRETKENNPASNNKGCVGALQLIAQSSRCQSKPRSPLSETSSMLIQEGNESDATNSELSKVKKDVPNETKTEGCTFKEPKPETALQSHGTREPVTDQMEQKESTAHMKARAADSNVPSSKTKSRAGRKPESKKVVKALQNTLVTDFYPIRRSNRKTKAELKNEEHRHIDDLIKKGVEKGMKVKHIEGKGRGIFADDGFKKGEYVVEYHGDLLELEEAKKREAEYAQDPQTGCYMYYFQYQAKTYCVDATKETSRLGRLINHSKTGNCQTKLHPIDGTPHLILVASRDIAAGEELLYDYGDRSKDSILAHPWLKC